MYVTCRPMSEAADCVFVASRTFWSSVDRASSFSTTVNCAVCDMNCVASVGFVGSWYFSCATSSCRKASRPSSVLPAVVFAPVLLPLLDPVESMPFVPVLSRGMIRLMGAMMVMGVLSSR